ncbi:HAD family hydrolase [Vibrio sp. SCSIO 43137]|uniref:HAD family hydrolase n=1 Tax=Vibrio sp. SCSIO 43137 TaxID=3021011 RepID=UPI002306E497|nr:HAD family phosphatase [Vibrio sp. SCSIO 43137]WCE32245.1 HAD family phosphatase [Vibrio sp. SCSIO 43137]
MLIDYKAVIFDMDGTLIDSRNTIEKAWLNAAKTVGVSIPAKDIEPHIHGRSGSYTLDYFFKDLSEEEKTDIKKLVDDYEETADTPMINGAKELLQKLKSNSIKVGLVTGSWPARVQYIFNLHGLHHYFDIVISREDVTEGKPNPEGFEKCAKLLNTSASECLIYEDSLSGLLAAKAFGAKCILVGNNKLPSDIEADGAIPDFKSVNVKCEVV